MSIFKEGKGLRDIYKQPRGQLESQWEQRTKK